MLFSEAINKGLEECLKDPSVLLCGQLVAHGHSALTRGLEKKYPSQVVTYPVSENLMNSSGLGLALAGKRPVILHERFDFCIVGMDALVNHIPIWQKKCGVPIPITFMVIVGHGKGQGPQQNKDFTDWFKKMEGWTVHEPKMPEMAYSIMRQVPFEDSPQMIVLHRELY